MKKRRKALPAGFALTGISPKGRQGFTLIETVMAVTVIAIIMYAVVAIFITSGFRGVNVEAFTIAQFLAESKLEEGMANTFAGVTSESQTSFSGDLSNYSYEIITNFVSKEALDIPVGYATDYKKILVEIRHNLLLTPVTLESIRADY